MALGRRGDLIAPSIPLEFEWYLNTFLDRGVEMYCTGSKGRKYERGLVLGVAGFSSEQFIIEIVPGLRFKQKIAICMIRIPLKTQFSELALD